MAGELRTRADLHGLSDVLGFFLFCFFYQGVELFGLIVRYVLGNTKTEDPKHMYYLKRFIAEALKCK